MDSEGTMSQANIAPVYSWLASELELHKIDAVIYTRHVLDIFLNPRHTTDLHLAKKEANIFAKLPGSKGRVAKQKYNKRTNSFHASDEVYLKKQMASNCLLSAVDQNNEEVGNDSAIKNLIQRLYTKLTELNIITDGKESSSSDDDHVTKKPRSVSLPSHEREDYHDAFPKLFTSTSIDDKQADIGPTTTNAVWGPANAATLPPEKSFEVVKASEETAIEKPQGRIPGARNPRAPLRKNERRRNKPSYSSDDPNPENHQTKIKRNQEKFVNPHDKPKFRDASNLPPRHRNHNQYQWKRPVRFDKKCRSHPFNRKRVSKTEAQKEQNPKIKKNKGSGKFQNWDFPRRPPQNDPVPLKSPYPAHCFSDEFVDVQAHWTRVSHSAARGNPSVEKPKLLSKWFRDPESGFLEFDPGRKTPATRSPNSSSEEVFAEEDLRVSSESWLWCPSPSLWEDEPGSPQGGAVSRLETIYRTSSQNPSEDADAGQLWEDYKAIFTEIESDFQKCAIDECEDKSEELEKDVPLLVESILNSVWAEETNFPCDFDVAGDMNGNYLPQDWNNGAKIKELSDDDCVDSGCLSCSAFRKMSRIEKELQLIEKDFSLSLLNQLENRQLYDKSSLDLCELESNNIQSDVESSRRQIWLRNSQDQDDGSLDQKLFFSGLHGGWDDFLSGGSFGDFGNRSFMLDSFFSDVTSTLFCSSQLHWLNWSYINPFVDLDRFLNFQSPSIQEEQEDVTSDEEDQSFIGKLVQSVLEVVTDPEELNPLLLDLADLSPEAEINDFSVPHPEDQVPRFSHGNFQEKAKRLADCVTDNEAWKTSLRIGNMWQAISGIRPVDIVYSEKQALSDPGLLQPSSLTHFRPIGMSEIAEVELASNNFNDNSLPACELSASGAKVSPIKCLTSGAFAECGDAQLKKIEIEIGKLLFENPSACPDPFTRPSPHYEKLGEDKGQQTSTFEQQIEWIGKSLWRELTSRPPKANSR